MTGNCRLCRKQGVMLHDSHFIPAAIYKISRSPQQKNPHPIMVSASASMVTPRQASDHLLCTDCEERFEQGGESWIIPRCWHDENTFQLRADLMAAGPTPQSEPDLILFEGAKIPAVSPDKLSYFAGSIFWRAAVHDWMINGDTSQRLQFGPFAEAFRLYLLGGQWPKHCALQVHVGNGMEEFRNGTTVFPHLNIKNDLMRFYYFTIPGITFYLFLGKRVHPPIFRYCSATSPERFVFMSEAVDKRNAQRNIRLFRDSPKVGALKTRLATPGTAAVSPWSAAEVLKLIHEE